MLAGAGQLRLDPRHLADENRVPAFQQLGVGQGDAEPVAEAGEERGVVDLAALVAVIDLVQHEAGRQIGRGAAGLIGPDRQHAVEIDVDHHPAEIEQQGVGAAGNQFSESSRRCSPARQGRQGSAGGIKTPPVSAQVGSGQPN